MTFSPGLRLFLLVVLPVTLSFRVWAGQVPQHMPDDVVQRTVAEFLARQNFEVAVGRRRALVIGSRQDCHLAVAPMAPEGWSDDALGALRTRDGFSADDRIAFVYRGRLVDRQPVVARLQDVWTRAQHRVGIRTSWKPMFGVRASPSCRLETLPWFELAEFPGPV